MNDFNIFHKLEIEKKHCKLVSCFSQKSSKDKKNLICYFID